VPVIAKRWWGAGEGSEEGPRKKYFYITVIAVILLLYSWIAEINMTLTQRTAIQW